MCRAGRDGESSTGRAREEERGEGELKSRRAEREKVEQKQSRLRRPLSTSSENKKARESPEGIYFASRESQRERERPSWFSLDLSPSAMLSPTFRGSDGDGHGKKQPSLDHGRLQAALFAAATASSGGVAGADASSNPPSRMPPAARTTSDDDEEDHEPASASGAAASTLKASSCRGRAPAVGAAE
jgi:hypothetical protein